MELGGPWLDERSVITAVAAPGHHGFVCALLVRIYLCSTRKKPSPIEITLGHQPKDREKLEKGERLVMAGQVSLGDLFATRAHAPPAGDGGGDGDASGAPKLKDDPTYAKFFKMLKMHLPKVAAHHSHHSPTCRASSILSSTPQPNLRLRPNPSRSPPSRRR